MNKRVVITLVIVIVSLVGISYFSFFNQFPHKNTISKSNTTLTLTGTITDSKSNPLIASISLIDNENKILKRLTSNKDGTFSMTVKHNPYLMIVSKGPEFVIEKRTVNIAGSEYKSTITLNRLIDLREKNWYSGELHQHSNESDDGHINHQTIFRHNQSRGLSFGAITDHNHLSKDELKLLNTEPFIMLPSFELTTPIGDYNIYNVEEFNQQQVQTFDDLETMLSAMNDSTIKQINHPYKTNKPFDFWDVVSLFDVMEVWHGIFPHDDIQNTNAKQKWFGLLNSGSTIKATCGSDDHYLDRNYLLNREETAYATLNSYSAIPMLYVYTETFTQNKIAKAIKQGNSFLTNGPLVLTTLDGFVPGSSIEVKNSYSLSMHIVDQLGINKVNIIKNGNVLNSYEVDKKEFKSSVNLTLEKGDWLLIECYGKHSGYALTNPFIIS